MAFWISFLPLLQTHKIARGQPKCVLTTVASTSYGHQCQFFVYCYWHVTGFIAPKIIENENKLLCVSFFSPAMCQPGKMLSLKRKQSWHIIVAFTPAVTDITCGAFLGDGKPILMWHSEKSPLVLYE